MNTSTADNAAKTFFLKAVGTCLAIFFCVASGCAFQGKTKSHAPGLPEEIHIASPGKLSPGRWNVCVFEFSEPPSAKGMGMAAAESLRVELLRNRVFSKVVLHPKSAAADYAGLLGFARLKKYDLMITGDLMYYLDGGFSIPSRVDERIRVVMARSKKAPVLWEARATEIARSVTSGDFIFTQRRPAPAETAQALLKKNAGKFCNMMLSRRPEAEKSSATERLTN